MIAESKIKYQPLTPFDLFCKEQRNCCSFSLAPKLLDKNHPKEHKKTVI